MSLEKALQENTEAVKALTELLQSAGKAGLAIEKGAGKAEAPKEAPKKEAAKEAPKEAPKKEAKTEEKPASTEKKIPYDDVKNKTLELVKAKGRDVVMSLLEDFGKDVKSAKDLEEGQYAEYLERVDDLLSEDDVA